MKQYFLEKIIVILILLIAVFFRFYNLNWDENFHLHPDERFLTMVGNALKIPQIFDNYFDQKNSSFNPANVGFPFFVYGNFPLILNKLLALKFNFDNYNDFTLLGRGLSAFLDTLLIIFIYKTAILLFPKKRKIGYFASLIYGLSVLPIQLSHFFAVDSFLNFFVFISLYFYLRSIINKKKNLLFLSLSAIFFAMGLGSKITAILILPLILIGIFFIDWNLFKAIKKIFFFLIVSYFILRLINPYYFENKSFFDPRLSNQFLNNINQLKTLTIKSLDNWYPPMIQWLSKNSFQHSLINNVIFGFGIINSILFVLGFFIFLNLIYEKFKKRQIINNQEKILILIFFWIISIFFYQSLQVNPTLRYFIFLYPFLSIFAGLGFNYFFKFNKKTKIGLKNNLFNFIIFISLFIWPIMFLSIYINRHTRIVASEWIYKNLPNQSVILGEEWDDPLPLWVSNQYGKFFRVELLPVFWPDNKDKWKKIIDLLERGNYYVLSSNRGWGSISTVKDKYPIMSKFYDNLLNNQCFVDNFFNKKFCFRKVKEFVSYPSLKIPFTNIKIFFDDQWSDEGFTVYDHPKVMIFEKI